MKPAEIQPLHFGEYPPQARALALAHLAALRQTPLALLPALLRDLKEYDWKFPIEQNEILNRIAFVERHPAALAGFARIEIPPRLEHLHWIDDPKRFVEELTASLWSSHQIDEYRATASDFVQQFEAAYPPPLPQQNRLVLVIVGRDAPMPNTPLFQKLRAHGCMFTHVTPDDAPQAIADLFVHRIANSPTDCAHWYIDGGSPWPALSITGLTHLDYPALASMNQQILKRIMDGIEQGSGPEVLRSQIGRLTPAELGAGVATDDPRLQHFAVSLLTEGSGTQIFSTSFVQWAARETLRSAQPQTLCIRFAPRLRQQTFNAMVRAASDSHAPADNDPEGSLIDADMNAYYTWLELNQLSGAEEARFFAWFENKPIAFIAGPGVERGARNENPIGIAELLSRIERS